MEGLVESSLLLVDEGNLKNYPNDYCNKFTKCQHWISKLIGHYLNYGALRIEVIMKYDITRDSILDLEESL